MDPIKASTTTAPAPLPLPEDLLTRMKETPQNPRYHAEGSVYEHVMMVMSEFEKNIDAYQLSPEDREVLYWAVVMHDVGKPVVTKNVGGEWRAQGHERAGVPIARQILLNQGNLSQHQRQRVLELVRYHHIPLTLGLKQAPIEDYYRSAIVTDLRLLGIFGAFDLRGRICEDIPRVERIIHQFQHDIEPKIRYDLGDHITIKEAYQSAPHNKKNALWAAWNEHKFNRISKLLPAAAPLSRPNYQCAITLGGPGIDWNEWKNEYFPDRQHFDLSMPGFPKMPVEEQFRMLRNFLSVFGLTSRKKLVLTGDFLTDEYRRTVIDYIRDTGGEIEYFVIEKAPEGIADPYTWPQTGILHPWEAHRITYC